MQFEGQKHACRSSLSNYFKVTKNFLGEVHAGYLLALKRGGPQKLEYSNGALALGSMFVHVQYGPKRLQIRL